MKWWPEVCQTGDMIRVRVGAIWHYGIYVSDDEVIEFGAPPVSAAMAQNTDQRIEAVRIEDFAAGGIVERAVLDRTERKKRIPPKKTVELARSRIGEGGYNLIHNNCEHFAYRCVFGIERSTQEESIREKWLNRPLFDVYVMKIPEDMTVQSVYPPEREAQLRATSNERLRTERYAVWTLLEKAVQHTFNLKLENLNFTEKKGKWSCDRLSFSLSHSHGAVAAVVSNGSCGVDIEHSGKFAARFESPALSEKMMRRICTRKELSACAHPEDFLALWTKKECIFKCYGTDGFFSRNIDTFAHKSETKVIRLPEEYVLSVCGSNLEKMRCYVVEANNFRQILPDVGKVSL